MLIRRNPVIVCRHIVSDMKRLVSHCKSYSPSVRWLSIHREDWNAIRAAGDIARAQGFVIEGQGENCTITYDGLLLRPTNLGKPHTR